MKKRIIGLAIFAILLVAGGLVVRWYKGDNLKNVEYKQKISVDNPGKNTANDNAEAVKIKSDSKKTISGKVESSVQNSNAASGLVSVEFAEDLEEKQVSAFYDETDHWIDAKKSGSPSVEDVEHYHSSFRKLPKSRKNECLQRALNLIPDENVMLLVGILMDKTEDKKLVTQIYNDVLNRDEVVKKPILQIIFKDKEHPCWTDTAWILDVTGQLPKKN